MQTDVALPVCHWSSHSDLTVKPVAIGFTGPKLCIVLGQNWAKTMYSLMTFLCHNCNFTKSVAVRRKLWLL